MPIRVHQIESLLAALRKALRRLPPLALSFGAAAAFPNDDRTRAFLVLEADAASRPPLLALIAAVDRAFATHGLPPFYPDPRPHVSVAWVLGDGSRPQLAAAALDAGARPVPGMRLRPPGVVCKVGQKVHEVLAWPG